MPDSLSDQVWYNGPMSFSKSEVALQAELFNHRAALFLTPTTAIPDELVGRGPLDVRVPIPTPDYLEFAEIRAYSIPRLWVDLLQRATGKIRWTPFRPAKLIVTRYDSVRLRDDHFIIGTKAIIDALKSHTTGRSDGQTLHYFGAISDDDPHSIVCEWRQELIESRSLSCTRLEVSALEA
ncbi:MAG: hypothetical protein Q8K78_00265 [Planctomycetaceae bacterium]|nr:hypothetical protein [Planctomycetaceae bacterium]